MRVPGASAGSAFALRARGFLVAASLLHAGCSTQLRSGALVDPPAGEYVLTDSARLFIHAGAGPAGPAVRIGDAEPSPLEQSADGRWIARDLGLEIERAPDGAVVLRRYGETVVAQRAAAPGSAGEILPRTAESIEELTPRLMIALNVPGVGIALIRDGRIAWRGYFGVKRSGSPQPIDSLTIFEAASMSKPAYTYPFMRLVEQGTIDLDVPLVRYLGRDYLEDDTLHRAITARMVLAHTTGFPNWRGDEGLTVNFPPGTQVGYSGEGFQYLQTVVEAVTAMPMDRFTRQALLDPLGLTSASYVWLDGYELDAAWGHDAAGVPRAREPYLEPNAAYTLYVTPVDYARVLLEIMQADRTAPHSLSGATRATMLESQHSVPDREPIARGGRSDGVVHFALGWRFDRTPSGDIYWHSGSNSTGFQCYAEFDPASGDGIVIMTNSSSGSPLWRSLMNATAWR